MRLRSSVIEPTSAIRMTGTAAMIEKQADDPQVQPGAGDAGLPGRDERPALQNDQGGEGQDRDDVGDEQPSTTEGVVRTGV